MNTTTDPTIGGAVTVQLPAGRLLTPTYAEWTGAGLEVAATHSPAYAITVSPDLPDRAGVAASLCLMLDPPGAAVVGSMLLASAAWRGAVQLDPTAGEVADQVATLTAERDAAQAYALTLRRRLLDLAAALDEIGGTSATCAGQIRAEVAEATLVGGAV